MGPGAIIEPSVVIFLLFGGTWINRARSQPSTRNNHNQNNNNHDTSNEWQENDCYSPGHATTSSESESESDPEGQLENLKPGVRMATRERVSNPPHLNNNSSSHNNNNNSSSKKPELTNGVSEHNGGYIDNDDTDIECAPSSSLLPHQEPYWHTRTVSFFVWKKTLTTPNTARFRDYKLSRLLAKFPFLVEAWYWALVYWTYEIGRAFTALTLQESTVNVARDHALQIIELEKSLHIFIEPTVQAFFLARPDVLKWINWLYSFIHIPGTIAFLVWLYYYTTQSNTVGSSSRRKSASASGGPALYQTRRRALAMANLVAFFVFTFWPCMPPRLLSDEHVEGAVGEKARSYGFVDTVHGVGGASSVWTQNKFCNQYAAMPSLHFGYSFLIGLTIMTVPLKKRSRSRALYIPIGDSTSRKPSYKICLPGWQRLICVAIGIAYPTAILIAIVSTANHFILDAVAGMMVCIFSLYASRVLLNLLWLEDWFLWVVRIHKPDPEVEMANRRRRQMEFTSPEMMN